MERERVGEGAKMIYDLRMRIWKFVRPLRTGRRNIRQTTAHRQA